MKREFFLSLLLFQSAYCLAFSDKTTTINEVKKALREFSDAREWRQFHNPKDLAVAIVCEATELLEIFQRITDKESFDTVYGTKREHIRQEIADVMIYLLHFCDEYNIDLLKSVKDKMALNGKKYPIEKCKGTRLKYTELQ